MTCVREDLTAFLDGALPPARREAVARHLEACGACRAERDRLGAALAALSRLPAPPEPSPGFEARLAARLAREGRPGLLARLAGLRWAVAAPAAGLAAAAIVAAIAIRQHRSAEEVIAANLEFLADYEIAASLGDVETAEDADVVLALDQLVRRGE
jgi:anti-sigma factor RsiW